MSTPREPGGGSLQVKWLALGMLVGAAVVGLWLVSPRAPRASWRARPRLVSNAPQSETPAARSARPYRAPIELFLSGPNPDASE